MTDRPAVPTEAPLVGAEAAALPVAQILPDLLGWLEASAAILLSAPPGSGKTSLVPLALLSAPWRQGGRIIVLEPRRVAARAAARRMASLLGESVGETVGMRMRMDTRVGPATVVEVVTEGVFTRMIADDPTLQGIAAVVLDEFHERSLEADLALALLIETIGAFRPDLRLLVMSATLDVERVRRVLPDAPLIEAEGRAFPVETRYAAERVDRPLADRVVAAVGRLLADERGSILAFLPSRGEVERAVRALSGAVPGDVDVHALHGGLAGKDQDRAIAPAASGRRKVVVATAIAETSVTIDGVRMVVDCGYSRRARHDRESGLTRLETVRLSQAAAEQRRGRAGRTGPGICVRLWPEGQKRSLLPHDPPEILEADLTALALLLHAEGIDDPARLAFLDPPPVAGWQVAVARLRRLAAIDGTGRITPTGRKLARLPLEPPLAAIVLAGARAGAAMTAARLAAAIADPSLRSRETDARAAVATFSRRPGGAAGAAVRMAARWAELAEKLVAGAAGETPDPSFAPGGPKTDALAIDEIALEAARAMPDRIAEARGGPGRYRLASGRGAFLDPADPLATEPFLLALDVQGGARESRILLALPLSRDRLLADGNGLVAFARETVFDPDRLAVVERTRHQVGAAIVSETIRPAPPGGATLDALAAAIARVGVPSLDGSRPAELLARLRFAAAGAGVVGRAIDRDDANGRVAGKSNTTNAIDDATGIAPEPADSDPFSDAALAREARDWLLPFAPTATGLADFTPEVVGRALSALAASAITGGLEAVAPARLTLPGDRVLAIDYRSGEPVARARVQDLFGLAAQPRIPAGQPVRLELLSPADRPIQTTTDLPAFWAGSWKDVRRELRGRYPKHHWPERPETAMPVRLGRQARGEG